MKKLIKKMTGFEVVCEYKNDIGETTLKTDFINNTSLFKYILELELL